MIKYNPFTYEKEKTKEQELEQIPLHIENPIIQPPEKQNENKDDESKIIIIQL